MSISPFDLCIVVPCYNEEAVLGETAARLRALLQRMIDAGRIRDTSEILFVDDGSRDRTWEIIQALCATPGNRIGGVKLSRNRGHQNAVLAGLFTTQADAVISIDADLQDDIEAIPRMIDAYDRGCDVVYGVRSERASDTPFKRMTAEGYYRILDRMGVEVVFNHADYRLMSRRAVDALRGFEERNLFLRGIIPLIGFRCEIVTYARGSRFAGESKYPLRKMLALAWQGITSFSAVPLHMITALGLLVSLLSIGMGVWALGVRIFTAGALPGWASIVIPLFLLSGVQLLALGIIGEYLAKVYMESKRRPHYVIDQRLASPPAASSSSVAVTSPAASAAEPNAGPQPRRSVSQHG